ncbi:MULTISPECIES: helix-turn-helix domain-containing protein [Terrisporobacter]|uniref:Helix-turn-helix domain-containing protein n=1 Tax=Terrisporobacter muris TaxID=2963284 RepID=A0A9X2MDE9_9FIRM|nr:MULTISPECIES: helix-turn-helix transcriptional regulator [Terrisporobacter]MCR1824748.1 helix-turn-helix domain-containing protein [Terrisporobacter muris]MDY3373089.1 helix-turn-helix transcriptional regulator [Terrisporobacter othiniensis]
MKLEIGQVIYKLRKEENLTQEDLAKAVGVSTAAVSKWESNSSYPDITLLPSIARFFNTSIDQLLNYEKDITNEEVMEIVKKCASLFEKDTVENGIKSCEGYIKEYPNNIFLKFRIASLYMMSIPSAKDEDEAKVMLNKSIELFEECAKSSEVEISEVSKYSLSSLYSMNEDFKKAEEVLLSLPKMTANRDDMLVGLYINQNKKDEAIELLRTLTYKKLSSLKMSLDSYVSLFAQEKDYNKAKEVLKLEDKLIDIFQVDSVYGVSNNLMYGELYAKEKNIKKTLDHIEKLLECYEMDFTFDNHLLFDKLELFSGVHSKTYLLVNLKKLLLDDKYDFLREDKRFNDILSKLEEISN